MGGGGGLVGSVQNAARSSLNSGYATVGTDTGHQAPGTDGSWALDNMEALVNFGHVAVHRTAEVAKAIMHAYYGKLPDNSYFVGCSRGGGQALMEAQRYPQDFDGIVAGAPAFDWTGFAALGIHIAQTLYPDPANLKETYIGKADLDALYAAIMEQTDAQDGLKDGIIDDPTAVELDLAAITALSEKQRAAVAEIYDGVSAGDEPIYPGFPIGAEGGRGGWFEWVVGPTGANGPSLSFAFTTNIFKYLLTESGLHGLTLVLDQAKTGAIEGRVTGGIESIQAAYAMRTPNALGTLTNGSLSSDGRFRIEGLAEDVYQVGVVDKSSMMHSHAKLVPVRVGESTGGIEIHFDAGFSIAGRVLNSRGQPIADADVRAVNRGKLGIAKSNTDGSYQIDHLPEGVYEVRVAHRQYRFVAIEDIPAGQDRVELRMPDRAVLEGSAIDADTHALITAYRIEMDPEEWQNDDLSVLNHTMLDVADQDGVFSLLSVRTGEIHLHVYADGYATAEHTVTIDESAATVQDIVIPLERPVSISGTVRDTAGEPIEGVYFYARTPPDPLSKNSAIGESSPDGIFLIEGLKPQTQELYVAHSSYARATLRLNPEERPNEPILVTLQPSAEIHGTVTLGGALLYGPDVGKPSGTVQVYDREPVSSYYWTVQLDDRGSFKIREVSAGAKSAQISINYDIEGLNINHRALFSLDVITDGANDASIDLSTGTAGLEGTIAEENAEAQYSSSLTFERGDIEETISVATNEIGTYRMDGLPAAEGELVFYEILGGQIRVWKTFVNLVADEVSVVDCPPATGDSWTPLESN